MTKKCPGGGGAGNPGPISQAGASATNFKLCCRGDCQVADFLFIYLLVASLCHSHFLPRVLKFCEVRNYIFFFFFFFLYLLYALRFSNMTTRCRYLRTFQS